MPNEVNRRTLFKMMYAATLPRIINLNQYSILPPISPNSREHAVFNLHEKFRYMYNLETSQTISPVSVARIAEELLFRIKSKQRMPQKIYNIPYYVTLDVIRKSLIAIQPHKYERLSEPLDYLDEEMVKLLEMYPIKVVPPKIEDLKVLEKSIGLLNQPDIRNVTDIPVKIYWIDGLEDAQRLDSLKNFNVCNPRVSRAEYVTYPSKGTCYCFPKYDKEFNDVLERAMLFIRDEDASLKRKITVDAEDAKTLYLKERIRVTIHEFMHVLTLKGARQWYSEKNKRWERIDPHLTQALRSLGIEETIFYDGMESLTKPFEKAGYVDVCFNSNNQVVVRRKNYLGYAVQESMKEFLSVAAEQYIGGSEKFMKLYSYIFGQFEAMDFYMYLQKKYFNNVRIEPSTIDRLVDVIQKETLEISSLS